MTLISITGNVVDQSEQAIKDALHLFDDPVLLNCKSGAEYLLTQLNPFHENFNDLEDAYNKFLVDINNISLDDDTNYVKLIKSLNTFSNLISESVISGKITSSTAAALEQGEGN